MIDPTVPSPERPLAWDVEIKTEDLSLKSRMAVMVQATKDSAQSLSKIDDEVRTATRENRDHTHG
jgi:SWI/SNF-related matrix-associated actin-dependent regulator of chromatin subfamily D